VGSITKALDGVLGAARRFDSWVNAITGLGGSRDPLTRAYLCGLHPLPDSTLRTLYHTNDLAARIVGKVVEDALRGGLDFGEESEKIGEALAKYRALDLLGEADVWGRLYGGCALVFAVEGEDLSLPWGDVRKGSLRALLPVDKRYISVRTRTPSAEPETYWVTRDAGVFVVHASRLVLFGGALTSSDVREELGGWDLSVLQRPYEILRDAGQSWRALQIMIANASLGVFKIQGLADMIASNKDALMARMEIVDMSRSVARSVLVDAENEDFRFEGAANLTGVSDVWREIVQRLAMAADMPVTVLAGMSPAGMNATGESDVRFWYDIVGKHRALISANVRRTVEIVCAAEGIAWDQTYEWPPLWQQTQAEKDAHETAEANTLKVYADTGVLMPAEITQKKFASDPEWADIVSMDGRTPDEGAALDPNAPPADPAAQADIPEGARVKDPATALNGAQVSALLEIVAQVVDERLPRESAVAIILAAFPLTPAQADKILGPVGKGFVPKEPPPPPAPFGGGPPGAPPKAPPPNGDNPADEKGAKRPDEKAQGK
jgi:phage-related protein (TIGR01555 family)